MKSATTLLQNLICKLASVIVFVGLIFTFTRANAQTTNIVWSENWERTNWTNDWHMDFGTWEIGAPTSGPGGAYSSQNCAATILAGNYPEPSDTRLIRHTSFVVPPASANPRLRFWHWFSFGGDDWGTVTIKSGNGDWQTIGGPYSSVSSGVWTYPSIDLSAYAGQTVQISFYLHSQPYWTGANTSSSGWYIDDIAVMTGPLRFNNPESWESGLGDWSSEKGTWQVGKPTSGPQSAHSGQNCAATVLEGNYWEPVDTRLISPPFVVPVASANPRFRFWHWFSFGGDDWGTVAIKKGNGDWQTIGGPYSSVSSGVWTYPSIDLSAYAEQTVQISFYLHSQPYWTGANTSGSGWYIDDLAIITGPLVLNELEDWEKGIGDWSVDMGTWQIGIPTKGPSSAHSRQNCAATVLDGNYWEPVDTRLISPSFKIPSASSNPALTFWHWYRFGGDDFGEVQIKVGNGNWRKISDPIINTSGGIWTFVYIPLSAHADSLVQIAYYLHSQPYWTGANTSDLGWYIDEIGLRGITTDVRESSSHKRDIETFALHQNYPNPFNPSTMITFSLPRTARATLKVFDTLGREIAVLVDQELATGLYKIQWNAQDVESGVYFYQLRAGEFSETKRLVLMK